MFSVLFLLLLFFLQYINLAIGHFSAYLNTTLSYCDLCCMCFQGWRWAWIISGAPGIVLAVVILITVREPLRTSDGIQLLEPDVVQRDVGWRRHVGLVCRTFFQPSLLVLCLAGSVRNAGENIPCIPCKVDYLFQCCYQMHNSASLHIGGSTDD